ncbi:MAG: ankyrin repeat domain-containing protein [Burkholderiales bacterium]
MDTVQDVFELARTGNADGLRALLATQPGLVNARNERGHSPVLIAQYHRRRDAVAVLLAADPDLDIFDAASVGRTDRVLEWLDRDPTLINAYSSDGFFPLGLAAFFGHVETVRALLARGADVAQVARNPMRVQALHAAVAARALDIVRLLVEAGAQVHAAQQEGWTPLHGAVHHGDLEMTRYLVAHGADPRQQNEKGQSAIGLAAEAGNTALLKILKGVV